MFRYTIFCTEEQTRKAVELGAPIKTFSQSFADEYRTSIMYDKYCSIPPIKVEDCEDKIYADIPTAEQMMEWLRSKGFIFKIVEHESDVYWQYAIGDYFDHDRKPSAKEATLAAIDAALEFLTENKK